jgi:hypothetical protein
VNAYLKHSLILAGLTVVSTLAFAETLTAKIDFPFRAGSNLYPAAEYEFNVGSLGEASPAVRIKNANVTHIVMPMPTDSYGSFGKPSLLFQCRQDSGCALQQIRSGRGLQWSFHLPKPSPADAERSAMVNVPLQIASR